ncbi:probable bifunctional methylthioribulose-1-phosphate dehydratase/enolase-phosphatase E1 1 isoform X2 [Phalaenopsis equestris]|uniref:probable bifunctional methylthioribulose-1-phosphate dehydratase/enolase-phosphatase E1 1 isoform X2 n=1 Tax=Phalaenopsis equestris TaxID=78828 RepID=UPI0009E4AC13|nr:probable bifunctional methylthioribulose-1-phosphate dehydratase/enolase-phosphatase E1 1 isoform X2 [Phalaenopsis equestris]
MAGVAAANGFPVLNLQAYLEGKTVLETRALVADLCRQFYTLGWVSGTGGSITIKVHDDSIPKPDQLIVMSPSGVQKERMISEDMYVLSSGGEVLSKPCPKSYPHKTPKCSDCAPLFMKIAHMEMIKGIFGHGYYDELVIPIIENTAYERELTKSLSEAISAYPKTTAVLVRNHGIYVWGDSWISAKTQAECYHYLFDAAIKLHQLGIDWTSPSHGFIKNESYQRVSKRKFEVYANAGLAFQASKPSRKCIVLDIEGTTTPISFVTEILFPYARDNVRKHLISTYDTIETKDDIELLRAQVLDDLEKGILGCTPIPPDDAGKEEVIESLVVNVEAMIKADRKITALKQLQGHIWRTGYDNNELQGVVFNDVPEALERWHDGGIKIYIYSSGSREAQRLIFRNTVHGDLRKYLCGFFDTTIGNKRDAKSYCEISQSVGVDKPSEILFITDVYQEAVAAKAAGLEAIISIRPGNAPLSENHEFKTITSFAEI